MHGDTFDADKLGGYALHGGSGRTIVPPAPVNVQSSAVNPQPRVLLDAVTGLPVDRDPRGIYKDATPGWVRRQTGGSL